VLNILQSQTSCHMSSLKAFGPRWLDDWKSRRREMAQRRKTAPSKQAIDDDMAYSDERGVNVPSRIKNTEHVHT